MSPADVCGPLYEEELEYWGLDTNQVTPYGSPNYQPLLPSTNHEYLIQTLNTKEHRGVVTLGILIKMTPNLFLDLSTITLGRIKMFLKFIFLCLQNMV